MHNFKHLDQIYLKLITQLFFFKKKTGQVFWVMAVDQSRHFGNLRLINFHGNGYACLISLRSRIVELLFSINSSFDRLYFTNLQFSLNVLNECIFIK